MTVIFVVYYKKEYNTIQYNTIRYDTIRYILCHENSVNHVQMVVKLIMNRNVMKKYRNRINVNVRVVMLVYKQTG